MISIRPASNNFCSKGQLSMKSDTFLSTNILLSLLIFFSTYCAVSLKLRYRHIVAFRTKKLNWWETGHWLTANFTFSAVSWKNIVWSFSIPVWYSKHLPGQGASIMIAFDCLVCLSLCVPQAFFSGGGTVVLVLEIIYPFSALKLFFMVKWLW